MSAGFGKKLILGKAFSTSTPVTVNETQGEVPMQPALVVTRTAYNPELDGAKVLAVWPDMGEFPVLQLSHWYTPGVETESDWLDKMATGETVLTVRTAGVEVAFPQAPVAVRE